MPSICLSALHFPDLRGYGIQFSFLYFLYDIFREREQTRARHANSPKRMLMSVNPFDSSVQAVSDLVRNVDLERASGVNMRSFSGKHMLYVALAVFLVARGFAVVLYARRRLAGGFFDLKMTALNAVLLVAVLWYYGWR